MKNCFFFFTDLQIKVIEIKKVCGIWDTAYCKKKRRNFRTDIFKMDCDHLEAEKKNLAIRKEIQILVS